MYHQKEGHTHLEHQDSHGEGLARVVELHRELRCNFRLMTQRQWLPCHQQPLSSLTSRQAGLRNQTPPEKHDCMLGVPMPMLLRGMQMAKPIVTGGAGGTVPHSGRGSSLRLPQMLLLAEQSFRRASFRPATPVATYADAEGVLLIENRRPRTLIQRKERALALFVAMPLVLIEGLATGSNMGFWSHRHVTVVLF